LQQLCAELAYDYGKVVEGEKNTVSGYMGVNLMVIMPVLVLIYLLRPDCVWVFIRRSSSKFIELF